MSSTTCDRGKENVQYGDPESEKSQHEAGTSDLKSHVNGRFGWAWTLLPLPPACA